MASQFLSTFLELPAKKSAEKHGSRLSKSASYFLLVLDKHLPQKKRIRPSKQLHFLLKTVS